jgi:AcrR family transcriptional regulator
MAQRKDAVANRERLLEAAFGILAERDADLTVRELALATGLGIGTAYRHFPSHDDLIRAMYDEAVASLGQKMAVVDPDLSAWDRIVALLETSTMALANNPGLRTAMRRMYDIDPLYRPAGPFAQVLQDLIASAQADGDMRDGITPGDLAVTIYAIGGLVGNPTDSEQRLIRRHLILTLDGMRASGASSDLPEDTASPQEFHALLHRSNAPYVG